MAKPSPTSGMTDAERALLLGMAEMLTLFGGTEEALWHAHNIEKLISAVRNEALYQAGYKKGSKSNE